MKTEILNDYLSNEIVDIDKLIDDFYSYVYIVVKNGVNASLRDEDIEEIVSDVFVAIWKNSKNLLRTTPLKPYLTGIAKNVIKNKYRNLKLSSSLSDYENNIEDDFDIEEFVEENEQSKIILDTIHKLKPIEYEIFIMFYYKSMKIKEIAKRLNYSTGNVKTILHRGKRKIKRILEEGGYSYGE